jgi:uridine kinase
MLIEGYLVLHDSRIRELFETSIWLDIDQSKSWERRVHFKKDGYLEQVLLPMNEQFVLPSKQHAKQVIDVTGMTKEEVFEQVQDSLKLEKLE